MKKIRIINAGTAAALITLAVLAVGILFVGLIFSNSVLQWLQDAHIKMFVDNESSGNGLASMLIANRFERYYTTAYVRTLALYTFILFLPVLYGLYNAYLVSRNALTKKPFKKSTGLYVRTIGYMAAVEFVLCSVGAIALKLIIRQLPFYTGYAMVAIAVGSLFVAACAFSFSALIDRAVILRQEAQSGRRTVTPKDDLKPTEET